MGGVYWHALKQESNENHLHKKPQPSKKQTSNPTIDPTYRLDSKIQIALRRHTRILTLLKHD